LQMTDQQCEDWHDDPGTYVPAVASQPPDPSMPAFAHCGRIRTSDFATVIVALAGTWRTRRSKALSFRCARPRWMCCSSSMYPLPRLDRSTSLHDGSDIPTDPQSKARHGPICTRLVVTSEPLVLSVGMHRGCPAPVACVAGVLRGQSDHAGARCCQRFRGRR
jgi:hypothetical protein